jgi:hypothetical protein
MLLVCALAASAHGAEDALPEPADALLARAFDNLYGDDYIQELTLSTRRRGGQAMVRRIQVTRKQSVRPGKALVRFLEPSQIRNSSLLILENESAYDDLWVYLPALRRSRRIGGSQRADSFFGTDLTYEDIEPKHVAEWRASPIGSGEVGGIPCRKLEIRPREGFESIYERLISCIDPQSATILHTEFFRRGDSVKLLVVDPDEVQTVGTRHIPFRMVLTTPRRRSETVVSTDSYELRVDIPEHLFTAANLETGDAERDRRSAGSALSGAAAP